MDLELLYIQQIIDGDVARYAWFVNAYQDMAFSIASRMLGNDEDAEEAVQDAFLQAFRNLRSFKGNAKFSTWLYRIVVNNALSRLKRKRQRHVYEDVELAAGQLADVESAYEKLAAGDQTRFINQAMEWLRSEDRLVLTLYYLNEQSLAEIAEITGTPRENVKMQLHRARGRMFGVLSKLLKVEINTL